MNWKNVIKKLSASIAICFLLFLPTTGVLAAKETGIDVKKQFSNTLTKAGITKVQSPEQAVGTVIGSVLTYIGVAILVLIIYAGIMWATAAGNDQRIGSAKKILLGAVIGLIIVFTASAAVNFVISKLGDSLVGSS